MKDLSFVFVVLFVLMTSSCSSNHESDKLDLNQNSKQIVFFSDEKDYEHEGSYYDAIIELKKEYPEEIGNMVVIPASNAKKYYDLFKVDNSPAILVVHGDQVIARVKGTVTKDQIIEPLSAVLSPEPVK